MNQYKIFILVLALSFLYQFNIDAQEYGVKGIVVDKKSEKILPFVHVIYNGKKQGVTSDIDGKFLIGDISKVEFLKFSYIGYKTKIIPLEFLTKGETIKVYLEEETYNLSEVTVYPGENPAHRIIRKVIENRGINSPEELSSYSCTMYNKMIFTADFENAKNIVSDTINAVDSIKTDTTIIKLKEVLKNQHIMMMESVSERFYKKPGKINEKVIATRVSGLKDPTFTMLVTQLQSFSFYNEIITLLDSRYISPISAGSTNRYFFQIEDTAYNEIGDTIFIISFRPKEGRNFEGLSGILNINTNNYAIQSVVAEPIEIKGIVGLRIIQNYKQIEGYWFPVELNTDLIFTEFYNKLIGFKSMNFKGIGKSYLTNIQINPNVDNVDFKAIEFDVSKNANKQADSVWRKYRHDTLTKQELRTYQFVDSIGKKYNLDSKMKFIEVLASGYLPLYFLDINIFGLLDYNEFEGNRLGFGFRTNEKISRFFSVGIYGAYGFKDKQWKYGGNFDFIFSKKDEIKLCLEYNNDVFESSGYSFLKDYTVLNASEVYRDYLLSDMTYFEEFKVNFLFRPLKKLKMNLFARQADLRNTIGYSFYRDGDFDPQNYTYTLQEMGLQVKYSPKESLSYMGDEIYSVKSYESPVFYLNVNKGFKNNISKFDYYKLELRVYLNFMTKAFGRTEFQIDGGKVFGDLPYFLLYNGHGSYRPFNVDISNSFSTMRMNEFLSDEFVSLFYRQDFGNLIINLPKFKPEFILVNNIGFGRLNKPQLHSGFEYSAMDKGYFETGIIINNIVKVYKILGFGFGLYYRYGPYTYSNISDNFAYKLSVKLEL